MDALQHYLTTVNGGPFVAVISALFVGTVTLTRVAFSIVGGLVHARATGGIGSSPRSRLKVVGELSEVAPQFVHPRHE
jgi:hypothetical protein